MAILSVTPIPYTCCPICGSNIAIVRGGLVCAGRNFCLWSVDLFGGAL